VPIRISRLRRWFGASAIALICVVGTFYFYARHRVQNALKQVPEKIGLEIQQSAKGFTISKSYQGRTLFKIEASKAVQFKEGGKGELHDVEITVYGRDSGRFDRISGKDFEYDAVTGDVVGKGAVQVDLETNPVGFSAPDQTVPRDLKNPIHIKTADLVFNQKTGNAHADGEVEFDVPQAHGSGVGLSYTAENSLLTLNSQVKISLNGIMPMSVTADRLSLSRSPRTLVLERPRVIEGTEHSEAETATGFLSADNKLERIMAKGKILIESDRPDGGSITADQLEARTETNNELRDAVFLGNVSFRSISESGLHGTAGRAALHFAPHAKLKDVHADLGVILSQSENPKQKAQSFELTAPSVDFLLRDGRMIRHAETSGPPQLKLLSSPPGTDSTVITAAKFLADFDNKGRPLKLHGVSEARIVNVARGKPDRVSTSDNLDANFQSGEITEILQTGNFTYSDGTGRASASAAKFTPHDQVLELGGSPRIVDGGMTTTAQHIRLNRATGVARAEGDVKTTNAAAKSENRQILFAENSPIHITAERMTASQKPASATYSGKVRLWQNSNSVEAPLMEFYRDRNRVTAERNIDQPVSTRLNQTDKTGKSTPVSVIADRLNFSSDEGVVHFAGSVSATSATAAVSADHIDCYLNEKPQSTETKQLKSPGSIDKIEANGRVAVTQPGRRATGNRLVYTASDDKYIMTGGPPSIFDAEHGNVTGVSLTLYGHDARVLVEGSKQSPSVTQTRVAR